MFANSTGQFPSFYFDHPVDSLSSSCSSSPPSTLSKVPSQNEHDSGCASDEDPTLALKINKGLSMGYDYDFIRRVIDQQNDGDDMSKFIETMVRTAEMQGNSNNSPKSTSPTTVNPKSNNDSDSTSSDTTIHHDVYIIDGADLAFNFTVDNLFSWRSIELCLKYLHSHGHKKVYVVLPYTLKHHRHDSYFLESKSLRDLERKNLLVYTNRLSKQTNRSASYTHINEMLKLSQKTRGFLITNVTLKDVLLDFTVYKQILEERVIRYRFHNENFQPLLVTIVNGEDGNDCEIYSPLCPYGKKCTYGSKCKYFHIERRQRPNSSTIIDRLSMKSYSEPKQFSSSHVFQHTKSGPGHLNMYNSPIIEDRYSTAEQSLADDAHIAYEYGLSSTPLGGEFTFVDHRSLAPQSAQQSWFGPENIPVQTFVPRSISAPQPTPNDILLMQQQQQQWFQPQQAASNDQSTLSHFDQNVLHFFSILSLQRQNNTMNSNISPYSLVPQGNPRELCSVNTQQGLADKIQSVRYLWESDANVPTANHYSHHQ